MPGLRLRCRGSWPEAAVYAAGLHRQQPHLFDKVERFVVVSEAHGNRLVELGLPPDKATTLRNFVPAQRFVAESRAGEGRYALVAGRLVEEKGFDVAVRAAVSAGVPLVVAGQGPDGPRLEQLAGGGDVRFTGLLTPERLAEVRREAGVVLAPSRCEEACPYSVLDASAAGVPVLASDRGGLPELVSPDGVVLGAEDQRAWTEALGQLWGDPPERARLGAVALERARERLGEERYYRGLMLEPDRAVLPVVGHQGAASQHQRDQRLGSGVRLRLRHVAGYERQDRGQRDERAGRAVVAALAVNPQLAVSSVILEQACRRTSAS